jgi:type I restriction enzyme S subunit
VSRVNKRLDAAGGQTKAPKSPWPTRALGDVCDVIGGGTPPKEIASYYGGTIPWATVRDMKADLIENTECSITTDAVQASATNIIRAGNVIIATRVGLGKICILGQDTAINQDLRGIIPRNGNVKVKFLYHWLRYIAPQIVAEGSGATVQGVKLPFIKSLQMPLPTIPEQERIVAILDQAFEGIARAKRNAEQNFLNAQSIFDDSVKALITSEDLDWPLQTLGQICQVERGSSPRPIKNYFTTASDGVNWIKIGDTVEGEKYIHTTKQRITAEGAKQSRFVQEGDFVLTNSMSFGRSYIMKTSGYIHDGWFVLRLKSSIDRDYLYYLLTSKYIRDQFNELASGSVVLNISGDLVKRAKLPVPPIKEQLELVGRLDTLAAETKDLQAIYERKIMALNAMKQSLLNAAFSGNL